MQREISTPHDRKFVFCRFFPFSSPLTMPRKRENTDFPLSGQQKFVLFSSAEELQVCRFFFLSFFLPIRLAESQSVNLPPSSLVWERKEKFSFRQELFIVLKPPLPSKSFISAGFYRESSDQSLGRKGARDTRAKNRRDVGLWSTKNHRNKTPSLGRRNKKSF